MIETNRDELVAQSVIGAISSPTCELRTPVKVGQDGIARVLPGTGGITYNLKVGDLACGWMVDHCEPAVSSKNKDAKENAAYNVFSCIGNRAAVVGGANGTGGAEGVVTGTHGGIEHVLIDFDDDTLDKLVIGDRIQVRAHGTGLRITNLAGVEARNLDPGLFDKLGLEIAGGKLRVPVAKQAPAMIMGSGLGQAHTHSGDYDIQLFDERVVEEWDLADIRLGDLVAIIDADHTHGRIFLEGAVSVGVVVHSDCVLAGHGPGVTTVLTSRTGVIEPVLDAGANIGRILGVGRYRN